MDDVTIALGPIVLAMMCLGVFVVALFHIAKRPELDMVLGTVLLLLATSFFTALGTYLTREHVLARNHAPVETAGQSYSSED